MNVSMLRNLTPHTINIQNAEGERAMLASSGVARVASTPGNLRELDEIPVPVADCTRFGEVEGLPASVPGVYLIVSALVGSALRSSGVIRNDVLLLGTGPNDGAIRENGQVVAVTRLIRY